MSSFGSKHRREPQTEQTRSDFKKKNNKVHKESFSDLPVFSF